MNITIKEVQSTYNYDNFTESFRCDHEALEIDQEDGLFCPTCENQDLNGEEYVERLASHYEQINGGAF